MITNILWINRDSLTNSGYQVCRAADVLLNGSSLEGANMIANNYDHWI